MERLHLFVRVLAVSTLAGTAGCDSPGPPRVEPAVEWVESSPPSGMDSVPSEVVAPVDGGVYATFMRSGGSLFRQDGGGWVEEILPEWISPSLPRMHLSADPGGGLTALAIQEAGVGAYLLHRSPGETWAAQYVGDRAVYDGAHGVAGNGEGTFLIVTDAGFLSPTLIRVAPGGGRTEVDSVAGLYPAGAPFFTDESTAFVNGVDDPVASTTGSPSSTWRLLRSFDSGATWDVLPLGPSNAPYTLRRGPGTTALAFTVDRLYLSRELGQTWTEVPIPEGEGELAEATMTVSGSILLVFRRPTPAPEPGSVSLWLIASGGMAWRHAGAGLAPLVSEPFEATVNDPSTFAQGGSALAIGPNGHAFLVITRRREGTDRTTMVRTARGVP